MVVRFSATEKLTLIKRFLAGERISLLCREAGISRTIFYRWIKVYKSHQDHKVKFYLNDKFSNGRNHYRKISALQENRIVLFSLKNSSFSIRMIAEEFGVSRHCVWRVLRDRGLNKESMRKAYIAKRGKRIRVSLDPSVKFKIIDRFEAGEKISVLCKEAGVSRTIFYRWFKQYRDAFPLERKAELFYSASKGDKHYRYFFEARVVVRDIIESFPGFSIRKIQIEAAKRIGARGVSRHLVHTIASSL